MGSLQNRLIFLTGRPGIGKTTVFLRTVDDLRTRGVEVGGMSTAEIRADGVRIGFKVTDLSSGKSGVLAHVGRSTGPHVGKYRVNPKDLEEIGVKAIMNALRRMEVVAIDEVAPMELCSG
ncbi:MAG: nucleoside triphosphatase, partial [Aigarchaeota archaeon]|nr:nucleoside triphosphatase [Aigarchaeota archaeon]